MALISPVCISVPVSVPGTPSPQLFYWDNAPVETRSLAGNNRPIFLLETVAAYTTRIGRTGYTKAVHPDAIDFTRATTNAQIARVKEMHATDLKTYTTQEGARAGLHKIIVPNVPAKILVELEGAESGLDEVEPRDLLTTIKGRAALVTVLDAMTLNNASPPASLNQ